jgi:hypothetical protein
LKRSRIVIGLNATVLAVTDEAPRILTVPGEISRQKTSPHRPEVSCAALPFGPLDPAGDRTLELGVRTLVRRQTGLELGYVEQLYTFGDRDREPDTSSQVISVAYIALVREGPHSAGWRDCYEFFPWEDWRAGRPKVIDDVIAPALDRWAAAGSAARRHERRERIDVTFGFSGAPWDGERVLERYELLYEAGLIPVGPTASPSSKTSRASIAAGAAAAGVLGSPMAADHRRILATALSRVRGKIKYRPVVFELLPPTFTLFRLQRVVEALAGIRLHKQNFRRLVEQGGLVEGTGQLDASATGRPAELFRFRREVLRERRAPGVGLPGVRR